MVSRVGVLGSGLRFPSLPERFFSGVTPRGFVTGNPELEAERSLSTDLALRYYGNKLFLSPRHVGMPIPAVR